MAKHGNQSEKEKKVEVSSRRERLPTNYSTKPITANTMTIKPIPHITIIEKLIEALSFRQIGVAREEYAVSCDGMRMFGVLDLSSGFDGCRFAIGLRNSHDKSFRLSCTVGLRVLVCGNLAFHGEYAPGTMFPRSGSRKP